MKIELNLYLRLVDALLAPWLLEFLYGLQNLLVGGIGIDRFDIGDTGLGIAKLITCGGLGIWALIDLFLIMNATREKNFVRLMSIL